MKIYISGISGTGMGPLALMAKSAGIEVCGSDLSAGAIYPELKAQGIEVSIGAQDGKFLKEHLSSIDWFVHTSALPHDHTELVMAREAGIKVTKRDELTAFLVEKLGLKMIAVAGTHGKTTTTAMITFASLKLGLPVSYIVGTTLGFAPSGSYHDGDKFFIYEADEYDRNFLKFHPWLAVLPFVSYDHPDIYPTEADYLAAFDQFKSQCENVIENLPASAGLTLAGEARREDGTLALAAVLRMAQDLGMPISEQQIVDILNEFPGVGRRFERVADGVYTDYAHHPEEVAATIQMAHEEAARLGKKGVVVIYQPHQNTRQHEVYPGYKDAFLGVSRLYWIPTFLTRENPELEVLTPEFLINTLSNKEVAEPAELDDTLASKIRESLNDGYLILLLTAGPADAWLRKNFTA